MNRSARKIVIRISFLIIAIVFALTYAAPTIFAISPGDRDAIYSNTPWYKMGRVVCEQPTGTSPDGQQGGSVYFVGDSLTVGMRGPGRLAEKVTSSGRQVARILANQGDSVSDALNRINNSNEERQAIGSANTVVVALGTNDGESTTANAFAPRINQMIAAIKALNDNATIFWMNAYKDGDIEAYRGVNSAISNQSRAVGFNIIDWYSEARSNNAEYAPFDSSLRVHPSDYGALADFVVSSLGDNDNGDGGTAINCACYGSGGSARDVDSSNNARTTWNYFIDAGLSPVATAAIMGNFSQEDSFNPKALQGGGESETVPLDGVTGYGIAQWTYITRQQNLDQFARSQGRLVYDIMLQLDFAYREMTDSSPNDVWERMLIFTRPDQIEQATRYFHSSFEGSADDESGIRERIDDAILYLDRWGSSGGSSGGTSSVCPPSDGNVPPGNSSALRTQVAACVQQRKISFAHNNDRAAVDTGYVIRETEESFGERVTIHESIWRVLAYLCQQGFSFNVSSMVGTHSRCSSTGNCPSQHWIGEAIDVDTINGTNMRANPPGTIQNVVRFMQVLGAMPVASRPDQVLSQGVGGKGCDGDPGIYVREIDYLSINNKQPAPYYTSRYVDCHMDHVHVGY